MKTTSPIPPEMRSVDVIGAPAPKPVKFDGGKPLIETHFLARFPRAVEAVATVGEYGLRKYPGPDMWDKLDNGVQRYSNAGARHRLRQFSQGPYDDGDSGLAHAAQEAWNAFAKLELMLREGIVENRRGNDIGPDGKPILGTARALT